MMGPATTDRWIGTDAFATTRQSHPKTPARTTYANASTGQKHAEIPGQQTEYTMHIFGKLMQIKGITSCNTATNYGWSATNIDHNYANRNTTGF